jgi:hypothetical protein
VQLTLSEDRNEPCYVCGLLSELSRSWEKELKVTMPCNKVKLSMFLIKHLILNAAPYMEVRDQPDVPSTLSPEIEPPVPIG